MSFFLMNKHAEIFWYSLPGNRKLLFKSNKLLGVEKVTS